MYLWLLPNESRPYLDQTFTSIAGGVVEVQNHSLGGHSPKSAFTLWQVQINNCIFFNFSLIALITPHPLLIGIRHEVLALTREVVWQSDIAAHAGLTRATINHIFWRHTATGTLVPGKSTGPLQKTTPCQDYALLRMVRQARFISARALTAQMRNLYGMRAGRKTINNRLLSRGFLLPIIAVSTWSGHRGGKTWRWPLIACHLHWLVQIPTLPVDGGLRAWHLPGERFQQRCQGYRVQAGGGQIHIWGAFHSGLQVALYPHRLCYLHYPDPDPDGAKSPPVLSDRYLTGKLYRGILWNTSVPFARQHFGDNCRY